MPRYPQSWIAISMGSQFWISGLMDRMLGIFWKFARIGERLSPYVSICCILMAVRLLPLLS